MPRKPWQGDRRQKPIVCPTLQFFGAWFASRNTSAWQLLATADGRIGLAASGGAEPGYYGIAR